MEINVYQNKNLLIKKIGLMMKDLDDFFLVINM
jgi:hypothetical protein